MHEASIALAIVEEISEQSQGESWEAVTCVRLSVGALTGVVAEALEFAWPFAAEGTIAHASRLVIEHVPLVVYCEDCDAEGTVKGTLPLCPRCARPVTRIVRGRELEIVSLEVRDAASTR
jgi:hydrogenase nickel incorporation protein HypA/HybF